VSRFGSTPALLTPCGTLGSATRRS